MATTKRSFLVFANCAGLSRFLLPAVILGVLVVGDVPARAASLTLGGGTPIPLRRLPTPEHITGQTLIELKSRMGRHGKTMSNLVRAVVLLDRPTIRSLAGNIADEEIVAGMLADTISQTMTTRTGLARTATATA